MIKVAAPMMAQRVVDRAMQVTGSPLSSELCRSFSLRLTSHTRTHTHTHTHTHTQAHGAMGLSGDRPLAGFFSWARILRLADGPDEVHVAAIGKAELRGR